MYAKVFKSLYQGTLRGNAHGILVFTNLLAHCDRSGVVDIHPRAIADEVGITVDQARAALAFLEAPDTESRTPDEDGRRIVRTDGHRDWGWRIVNYAKYRAIRNEEDRAEQNRAAQQKWRDEQARKQHKPRKPASATISHDQPMSAHAEGDAYAEEKEREPVAPPPSSAPAREPDTEGHTPTRAGLLCRAIKLAGVPDVNTGHPDLARMLAAGIPDVNFTATAEALVAKGKGKFALLLKTVEGQWNDAQAAPALAAAAAQATGVSAVAQTASLLLEQKRAGEGARSPEAQAARKAALARIKGQPA